MTYPAHKRSYDSAKWQALSADEARASRYYGFAGWLLVLYLLMLIGFVDASLEFFGLPSSATFDDEEVTAYISPEVERVVLFASNIVYVPFFVLAPLKHRMTPWFWLFAMWAGALIAVTFLDWSTEPGIKVAVVVAILGLATLFSWYVLASKRVNATYLHRVRRLPHRETYAPAATRPPRPRDPLPASGPLPQYNTPPPPMVQTRSGFRWPWYVGIAAFGFVVLLMLLGLLVGGG